jgi:hypothetical protein
MPGEPPDAWVQRPLRSVLTQRTEPETPYQCVGVGVGDGVGRLDGAVTRTTLNELSAWFLCDFSPVKRYSGQPL